MIWKLVLTDQNPQVVPVYIRKYDDGKGGGAIRPYSPNTVPGLLHICSESRAVALRTYQLAWNCIPFRPQIDTLYLSREVWISDSHHMLLHNMGWVARYLAIEFREEPELRKNSAIDMICRHTTELEKLLLVWWAGKRKGGDIYTDRPIFVKGVSIDIISNGGFTRRFAEVQRRAGCHNKARHRIVEISYGILRRAGKAAGSGLWRWNERVTV
jgi:hypothetical protein